MKETNLYITRHGQTMWNVEGRMQGHQDSPLTELGQFQAAQLGELLKSVDVDLIYTSPSGRTVRTAEIVRGERAIPIQTDSRLREINMGDWEGRTKSEVEHDWTHEYNDFCNAPDAYQPSHGGETFHDVARRAVEFVNEIIAAHEGKTVLLVTHTVTLKVIMSFFEHRPLGQLWNPPFIHPTSLSHVVGNSTQWQIARYGDMSHLCQ